jgi:mannose-6-phosphate isomerase-like protein (cupin superfamily)
MSDGYTKTNVADVDDMAPGFGLGEIGEARFPRKSLGAETIGMAHYRLKAGKRMGFGHHHKAAEEIYVVVSGGGRMKLDDDIVELAPKDIVYVQPATIREWEAGSGGLELLAFGAHPGDGDGEMLPGWWTD